MSPEKVRGITLQQRLGFQDKDLTTPMHDAIMLWLSENVAKVISELEGWDGERQWSPKYVRELREAVEAKRQQMIGKIEQELLRRLEQKGKGALYCDQTYEDKRQSELAALEGWPGLGDIPHPYVSFELLGAPTWEFAITNGKSNFLVGFIDLMAAVQYAPYLEVKDPNEYGFTGEFPSWEFQFRYFRNYAFEVKTSIPSAGEVIRQIRMYEEYQQAQYVIVSPDDRWAKVFEAQKIRFYKAPDLLLR